MKRYTLFLLLFLSACAPEKEGITKGDCQDNKDNDKNGFIDCEDPGCKLDDYCIDLAVKAKVAREAARRSMNAAKQKQQKKALALPYIEFEKFWAERGHNGKDINLANAKEYCKNLNLANKTDWRLPTEDEAIIMALSKKLPQEPLAMWTSTLKSKKRGKIVGITTGASNDLGVSFDGQCRARCVRDKK
jgi:hypothetical protein